MERQAPEKKQRPPAEGAGEAADCWQDESWQPTQATPPSGAFPWNSSPQSDTGDRVLRLVQTLKEQIIPRLVEAHRAIPDLLQPAKATLPSQGTAEVQAFVDLVLQYDDGPMFAKLAELRAAGMSIEAIYLDLLAPAAQRMGDMWSEDLIDFTEVTVGVGRLQHVLRDSSPAFGTEVAHPAEGRRVLLVPAPGEQHTFGLSMVSEFFRRAGWEVTVGEGGSRTNAIDLAQREWFDVIGFSLGTEGRLDWLRTGIASVREHSRNRSIGVLVGGPLFNLHPEYVSEVGADATASDGLQAPLCAETLVAERARRTLDH